MDPGRSEAKEPKIAKDNKANRQEIIKPLASSRFSPLINACHKNGGRNWRRGEGGYFYGRAESFIFGHYFSSSFSVGPKIKRA